MEKSIIDHQQAIQEANEAAVALAIRHQELEMEIAALRAEHFGQPQAG